MIGRVRWIMRVPVAHLWQQSPQRIQKIEVGARVQVCRSESTGGMGNEDGADALPVFCVPQVLFHGLRYIYNMIFLLCCDGDRFHAVISRSEEHTSELQSPCNLVCRLLLEKKKNIHYIRIIVSC